MIAALAVWISPARSAGLLPQLGAPERLVVDGPLLESGLVSLGWLPVEGAVSYEVLRGTVPEEAAAVVIATNVTASQYVDATPPHAVELHYRVRAVAGDSVGPWAGPLVARQEVLLWTRSTAGRFTMPVVFTNGTVVVGVNRRGLLTLPPDLGVVYAVDPRGDVVWQRQAGSTSVSHPVITPDERVLLAAGHDRESVLWSVTASGDDLREVPGVVTTPFLSVAADGTIFLAGQPPGMTTQVRSLDSNGVLQWSDGIGMGTTPIRFSVHPDGLLAVGNMGLTVFRPDGHRHWVAGGLNQSWGEPAWAGPDRLMAVNSRQELMAFRADGTPLWTNRIAQALSPIPGPAVDSQGSSYLTDARSNLHAIDAQGQRLWQVPLVEPTPFTPVLDADGRILVAAGTAIAMQNPDGSSRRILFLPDLPSEAPVLTPDGILLVVVPGQIRAYRHSAGLHPTAAWPCARHDARGTSAARFDTPVDLQLGIRIEGELTLLVISGPPSNVQVLVSTDLGSWEPEAELTLTGAPLEWAIPPGVPPPAYFQARVVQP